MQFRSLSLAAIGAVALALPAWAHHSHANYQTREFTHLEGTVKAIRWINPHSLIHLEVMDDEGQPTVWALEGASPIELTRAGWKRDDIKVGDTIKVRCHQLRDGSNGCLLGFVTPEGGVEKEFDD
ncbi:MAG: DUF6152 family protein [Acidobacteria bacterium]|nr:DUF6152 family protein [Acidobacteriota bacterium]